MTATESIPRLSVIPRSRLDPLLVLPAVAVGEPSFGNIAPLAVGLTVFIGVLAGQSTLLNPKP